MYRGLRSMLDGVKSGGFQFVSLSRIGTVRWKIGAVELEPIIFPVLSLVFLRVQVPRDSGEEKSEERLLILHFSFLVFSPSSTQPGGGAAPLGEAAD